MQIQTGKSYLCRTGNHMVEITDPTTYNCQPCFYGIIWFLTPGQTFAREERAQYTSRRFWPTGEAIDGYFDAVEEVRVVPRLCDANTGEPMGQERLEVVARVPGQQAQHQAPASSVIEVEQEEDVVHLDPREIPDMGQGWPRPADRSANPPVSGASWRSPEW